MLFAWKDQSGYCAMCVAGAGGCYVDTFYIVGAEGTYWRIIVGIGSA